MRKLLLLVAAVIVLIGNGWGVWQAWQNRTEPRGGTLFLTERELPLQPMALESSVTLLRLNWSVGATAGGGGMERYNAPAWLNTNKLAELGFDCTEPLTSPRARRHYGSEPARRVYLALEYRPEAVQEDSTRSHANTGLVVADAALDAERLRQRYPDPAKHVICRGLVRMVMSYRNPQNGSALDTPYLQGWIEGLTPSEVSVPMPENRVLRKFQRAEFEDENRPPKSPRFSARVHWGKNYEPWVDEVRPLEEPR